MPISAVFDSTTFNGDYFNPIYGTNVTDCLNKIEANGVIVVDSGNELQESIFKQIEQLPTKYRQRLQIWVEELFKNRRDRVVQCRISQNYTFSEDIPDLAYYLKTISRADILIVGNDRVESLKSDHEFPESIVQLSMNHYNNFDILYNRSQSTDTNSEIEMEGNIIHSAQFDKWIASIVNGEIFKTRKQLTKLLAEDSPYNALEQEFRELFNGYYALVLEIEEFEKSLLAYMQESADFFHLRHRVSAVEAQRRCSTLGREAQRMGILIEQDPQPEIKVSDLSHDEFRTFVNIIGNWSIFVSRERLVKLMESENSTNKPTKLRSEFCEFFVCFLELELFLENYDYDPDDGLELRSDFVEQLEREDEYIMSGGKMLTLKEVVKRLGT